MRGNRVTEAVEAMRAQADATVALIKGKGAERFNAELARRPAVKKQYDGMPEVVQKLAREMFASGYVAGALDASDKL